jgi:hypothetical protein
MAPSNLDMFHGFFQRVKAVWQNQGFKAQKRKAKQRGRRGLGSMGQITGPEKVGLHQFMRYPTC